MFVYAQRGEGVDRKEYGVADVQNRIRQKGHLVV